ncbi:hypothetical protein [Salinicoccus luteus]|uniref:hypothetical protein n=1 Tax=Salinicoccus luteus TaxID=367840 RepID=UPI0004E1F4B6|nr:hypothetical protein [Salinicoccus luteus]
MNNNRIGFIDTGLLIATFTAISYFIAYSYEKAYLSYFGFGEFSVLSVSITSLVTSLGSMVIILLALALAFIGFKSNLKVIDNPIIVLFSRYFFYFFCILIFLLFFRFQYIFFFTVVIISFLAVIYVTPLFKYRKTKGYMNKVREKIKDLDEEAKENLLEGLHLRWNYSILNKIMVAAIICFFAYYISSAMGYYAALSKEEFYITELENRELVVFKIYGDSAVAAPFDTETAEYSNSLIAIKIVSDSNNIIEFDKRTFNGGIKVRK